MQYYELYEDAFNLYMCIFESMKGGNAVCVCVERIPLDVGSNQDGTFYSMIEELKADANAWEEWKHREQVPQLMFMRDLCYSARQIGYSQDISTGWTIYKDKASHQAMTIINAPDDNCADCSFGGPIEE